MNRRHYRALIAAREAELERQRQAQPKTKTKTKTELPTKTMMAGAFGAGFMLTWLLKPGDPKHANTRSAVRDERMLTTLLNTVSALGKAYIAYRSVAPVSERPHRQDDTDVEP